MSSHGAAITSHLPDDLIDRARSHFPLPVADAVAALDAADNPHQRRDRVVECFRTVLRYNAALALAARLQYGAGPGGDGADLHKLLLALRGRHLTDGQWMQLLRSLLKPWAARPDGHPLPALVTAVCGPKGKRPPLGKEIDGLLEMRRVETVAHGGTGGADEIEAVLARRMPQLAKVLDGLGRVWSQCRLAVPLAAPQHGEAHRAWLLMGDTPARGRWRRVDVAGGGEPALVPGQPIVIDEEARPLVALHPVAMLRRPSPEVPEELFVLDGGSRRGARYVAFPSMAEHRESELWPALEPLLARGDDEPDDVVAGVGRPYRGLHSFAAEHARLFFGREQQIEQLANRVRRYPFVTVTGRSGTGKSSLLSAGVFPRLDDHVIVTARPGPHPARALATRLDAALVPAGSDAGGDAEARRFADVLDEAPETLGVVLERWCRAAGRRVVIAIDQAEEAFTLCDDDDERERFAAALASAGFDPDGPIRVVVSLREDFFARLATLEPLRGLYSRQIEVVTTPDRDALVRTLVAPAALFGYQFEDDELVASMVEPVAGEPAALALLSFCADQLWEARDRTWKRLTRAAYERLGGVEGALATHAEGVLARLGPAQRTAARHVLLRLVTGDGTRALVPRRDLEACAGDRAAAEAVVAQLIDARLLTVRESDGEGGDGVGAVELVHEALIRHWDRLRTWLEEDRELIVVRHRVADAAAHWRAEGSGGDFLLGDGKPLADAEQLLAAHAELLGEHEVEFIAASRVRARRRTRLKQAAIAGLVVLAAGASGAAYYAVGQSERAQEREREAAQRSDDLVLLRAGEAVDADAAVALAWLRSLDIDERTAPRARLIAADAVSRGVTTHVLRFGERAPVRLRFAEDRLVYFVAGGRAYEQTLDGERREVIGAREERAFLTYVETDPSWRYATVTANGAIDLADLDAGTVTRLETDAPEPIRAFPAAGGRGAVAVDRHGALWAIEADGASRRVVEGPIDPRAPLIALAAERGRLVYVREDGSGEIVALDGDERFPIAARAEAYADEARGGRATAAAALSPDGAVVVIADVDGGLRMIATADGASRRFDGFSGPAREVVFARSGARFAVVHADEIFVWEGPVVTQRVSIANLGVERVAISDDGSAIAGAAGDGTIRVWSDRDTGSVTLRGHRDPVIALGFSPDGARLASASLDRDLRVWRLPTTRSRLLGGDAMLARYETVRFRGDGSIVAVDEATAAVFSADGERVATWPKGSSDLADPFDLPALDEDEIDATCTLGPGGELLVATGAAPSLWRVGSDEATPLASEAYRRAAISSTGLIALYDDFDPGIAVVTADGEPVRELTGTVPPRGDPPRLRSVAFSPDGAWLVEVDAAGTVKRWSTESWAEELLARDAGALRVPAFSHDGALLAVPVGPDVALWDLATGERATLSAEDGPVDAVAFGPGAEPVLVAFGASDTIRLWNPREATSRTLPVPAPQHAGAFSADGRTLVTLGRDGAPILWDVASGQKRVLPAPAGSILGVAISADGHHIAGGSDKGAVHLWTRDTPSEPAELERFIAEVTPLDIDAVTGQLVVTRADR